MNENIRVPSYWRSKVSVIIECQAIMSYVVLLYILLCSYI